jgi:Lrp/AsnC family transcriptional regulator for asnA, asnC and gidA|tara:strand:+ start:668 stop:1099 length:432 start_codon:yes stop_codon:yes gene_type:complete
VDKKDEKILELLKEDSRLTSQQISKKTLIPITTIHNRLKKLRQTGIIKKYSVVLDNKKVGRPISAFVHIAVDYRFGKQSQVDLAKKIYSRDVVEDVCIITGDYDVMVKIRVKDMDELNGFVVEYLRMIEGIERTKTSVIMHEV